MVLMTGQRQRGREAKIEMTGFAIVAVREVTYWRNVLRGKKVLNVSGVICLDIQRQNAKQS